MTAGADAFEASCRETARQLRRLPRETRQAIAARATDEVARPVAAKVAGRHRGPWAAELAAGTKARKAADPTINVGGARPVVSGGASVRQLVYGNEWGGDKRVTRTTRRTRNGGRSTTYRHKSTRQFATPHPSIINTLRGETGFMLDAFAGIVLDVFDQVVE